MTAYLLVLTSDFLKHFVAPPQEKSVNSRTKSLFSRTHLLNTLIDAHIDHKQPDNLGDILQAEAH